MASAALGDSRDGVSLTFLSGELKAGEAIPPQASAIDLPSLYFIKIWRVKDRASAGSTDGTMESIAWVEWSNQQSKITVLTLPFPEIGRLVIYEWLSE